MPHTDGEGELKPLVQPRVIRALKNRPRLIDKGVRREMLEEMEQNVIERRTTGEVASRVSHTVMKSASDAGEPVVRNRMWNALERLNESILESL